MLVLVKPLAVKLVFRFVDPCGRPFFKILAMAITMVTIMCLFVIFMMHEIDGELPVRVAFHACKKLSDCFVPTAIYRQTIGTVFISRDFLEK